MGGREETAPGPHGSAALILANAWIRCHSVNDRLSRGLGHASSSPVTCVVFGVGQGFQAFSRSPCPFQSGRLWVRGPSRAIVRALFFLRPFAHLSNSSRTNGAQPRHDDSDSPVTGIVTTSVDSSGHSQDWGSRGLKVISTQWRHSVLSQTTHCFSFTER